MIWSWQLNIADPISLPRCAQVLLHALVYFALTHGVFSGAHAAQCGLAAVSSSPTADGATAAEGAALRQGSGAVAGITAAAQAPGLSSLINQTI